MLFALSSPTAIYQSVARVELNGVAPLEAVSQRFNFNCRFNKLFLELTSVVTGKHAGLQSLGERIKNQLKSIDFLHLLLCESLLIEKET